MRGAEMSHNPNVVPTAIVDKNGKKTTVRKKTADTPKTERVSSAPVDPHRAEVRRLLTEHLLAEFPSKSPARIEEIENLARGTADAITSVPASLSAKETAEQTKNLGNALGYGVQVWGYTVEKYKKFHSEFIPTDGVNYLELDDNDTSLPWADRYKIKMAKMVAAGGRALRETNDIYGWEDPIYKNHFTEDGDNCKIAEVTSLIEDEWSQFADTYTGNSNHEGAQCDAQCSCGWFRGKIRMEGTLGDFLGQLRGGAIKDDVFDTSTHQMRLDEYEKNR